MKQRASVLWVSRALMLLLILVLAACDMMPKDRSELKEFLRPDKPAPSFAGTSLSGGTRGRQPQITVYKAAGCEECVALERFLKKENYRYVALDVEKSEEARKFLTERGVSGLPVVKIGNEVISGYWPDRIKNSLYAQSRGQSGSSGNRF